MRVCQLSADRRELVGRVVHQPGHRDQELHRRSLDAHVAARGPEAGAGTLGRLTFANRSDRGEGVVAGAPHDLVVRRGTCFDGLGSAPVVADVAIAAGRIVEIGTVTGATRRTFDAEGMYVAPGFVDGHTHLDAQIFWDPHGASLTGQGVTAAVMGNCGFTLAPGGAEQAALVVRSIERAEEMSPAAIAAASRGRGRRSPSISTPSTGCRRPCTSRHRWGTRRCGWRRWANAPSPRPRPTTTCAAMEAAVRDAIDAGSLGFTTSRSSTHTMTDGAPVPSRIASWDEVRHLVLAMGGIRARHVPARARTSGRRRRPRRLPDPTADPRARERPAGDVPGRGTGRPARDARRAARGRCRGSGTGARARLRGRVRLHHHDAVRSPARVAEGARRAPRGAGPTPA